MTERQRPLTPDEERRIEHTMETRGISYAMARAIELGERLDDGKDTTPSRLPGKPLRFPPSGHVRDYESDRDHDDAELRANYQPPSPDQAAINAGGRTLVEDALDVRFGKDRRIAAIEARVAATIPIEPDDVEGSLRARERQTNALLRTHFDNK